MSDETKLDLDAIEARANAATPGEWSAGRSCVIESDGTWIADTAFLHSGSPNAEFIAHARTDVPALVAEVRRLRDRELQPGAFVRCRCGSAFPPKKRTGMGVEEHTCPGCRRAETAEDEASVARTQASERCIAPDRCPITGRRFFMVVDGLATYGGPHDSYTIPERDEDGAMFCRHYDHDEGGWSEEDEYPALVIVATENAMAMTTRAEKAEKRVAELEEAGRWIIATSFVGSTTTDARVGTLALESLRSLLAKGGGS